ncbi:GD16433 [Drosophila simulans]|uniref:GD16433 n=1 Tax=Drosophila simulans TaxID=7240 RepID=B4R2M6_DROSI|nr:GD16433 [Drosophila simulans]
MSTRGGFIRLTILVTAALLAVFVLLSALQRTDDLKPTPLGQYGVSVEAGLAAKVTPPPIRHLEEPIKEVLVRQLEQELPEVDYGFWYHFAKPMGYKLNKTCALYPDPLDLQLHNIYWQTFVNSNVTFRLYAAYLDKRKGLKLPTFRTAGRQLISS